MDFKFINIKDFFYELFEFWIVKFLLEEWDVFKLLYYNGGKIDVYFFWVLLELLLEGVLLVFNNIKVIYV